MLLTVLTVIQVFAAIGVTALVLLQRGRGADAGAGFGAGASATVFGARGASTGLSRATAILAAVFMLNSLGLAYLGSRAPASAQGGLLESGSVTEPSSAAPAPTAPGATSTAPASPAAPASGASGAAAPSVAPATVPAPAGSGEQAAVELPAAPPAK